MMSDNLPDEPASTGGCGWTRAAVGPSGAGPGSRESSWATARCARHRAVSGSRAPGAP